MFGNHPRVVAINATRLDRGFLVDDETPPQIVSPQSEPRQAPPEASFAELGFDRHLQAANTEDAAVGPGSIPRDDGLSRSLTFLPESFFPELRKDLAPGLSNWRLCVPLGTTELRRRYSRSRLGQTWITVTTGLSSALLAGFWSALWHQPFATLFLHVLVGQILWLFVSGIVIEATTLFATHARYLHNQHMPLSVIVASSV